MEKLWDRAVVLSTHEREADRLDPFLQRWADLGLRRPSVLSRPLQAHGAEGCLAGHRSIVSGVAEDDETWLVMEDDAVFRPSFLASLTLLMRSVPSDWECLWLGGRHFATPERIRRGIVRINDVRCSHAYLIRPAAARALVAAPDDGLFGCRHVDEIWSRILAPRRRTYAPMPWIVGQAAGFSDVAKIDCPERWS